MICLINTGKNWAEPNEDYPIRKKFETLSGENNPLAKFTNEEVLKMRTLYSEGHSPKEIKKMYASRASESAIEAILYGKSYKKLPYWSNTKKEWIKPCID